MANKNRLNIIILAMLLILLVAMVVQLFPLLSDVLENRKDETNVATTVDALGWRGPPALIGLAALQVVFPLIPAAAVGVLTGLSYSVYWGPLIFLVGIALGNILVVFAMRRIDSIHIRRIKHRAKHHGMLQKDTLERIKRPEIVAFFLFMIPFISGAGPYLFAETGVKLWKYVIAVVAGSIPTTIVYVFLGDSISQGSYTAAIITGAVLVALMVLAIIFRKKILNLIIAGVSDENHNDIEKVINKYHKDNETIKKADNNIDETKEADDE